MDQDVLKRMVALYINQLLEEARTEIKRRPRVALNITNMPGELVNMIKATLEHEGMLCDFDPDIDTGNNLYMFVTKNPLAVAGISK